MRENGLFVWYGYFNDYRKRIERIKNAGFDGVMIWWEDEEGDWPISRFEMVSRAKEMELSVFNIHMAGTDDNAIWNTDNFRREKHLKPICQTIEEISDLGFNNLVLHLCEYGKVPDPNLPLLHSIEALLPYAENNKVTLSLENTWRADYLEYVWQAFPGVKELGFCFDTSHANIRDQFYLIEKYGHLLSALHISDNDGSGDQHRLPFDGNIDFSNQVLPYLKGNNVPFTMELIANPKQFPDEEEFLRIAHNRIVELAEEMDAIENEKEEPTKELKKDIFSLFPF
ncbi:MAG: sugar phosphate isomerase/epimerase [Firmicutes bacterium]|nr:sugar phosphate isomerase/epimerase [Bacillota bacterium]